MKKIFSTLFIISLLSCSYSQVNSNAIGLRGGSGNLGYGGEITFQKGIGEGNRLELDFGARGYGNGSELIASGIYHWVKNITSGLNWYIGPGAQVGIGNGFRLGVGGQIGIEFDLNEVDIPLLISIDSRPMFGFGGSGFRAGAFGALRYTF
ncbi:MAG: hypothetical protein AB8B72_04970 [Crocinitomicaceae bacterium]